MPIRSTSLPSISTDGDLLLLTLEQLAREPDAVFAKVCDFLGIDSAAAQRKRAQEQHGGLEIIV